MTDPGLLMSIERSLQSIGYQRSSILRNYEYADCVDATQGVRQIELACFAQHPPDYRNACLGVTMSNGLSGQANVERHCSLGAPLIFEIGPNAFSSWAIQYSSGEQRAALVASVPLERIEATFDQHKEQWAPGSILRAKGVSLAAEPLQLDFVDFGNMSFLEGVIHTKLKELLSRVIAEAVQILAGKSPKQEDWQRVFRIVFRYLAAKIFRDRKHDSRWESNDAVEIFRSMSEHYSELPRLTATSVDRDLMDHVWQAFLSSFHFQNLSIDDLAYVYENAFVTPETRKDWGVHSTPSPVAEYMVRKLPFEQIPRTRRHVLEPCAGHGIFLIAAMRRMREMLPPDWGELRRHQYFQQRLVGIETDPFALEVSRLCLTLADYPNPNGWRLRQKDIFQSRLFEEELNGADVVLCNPPFEKFTDEQRGVYKNLAHVYKPAEALERVMTHPPALLGFVLPQAFLYGASYRDFHPLLARNYDNIEIVSLPDATFTHADVESALLMAWGRGSNSPRVHVACSDVRKSESERFFRPSYRPHYRTGVLEQDSPSLWIPPLIDVWNSLSEFQTLGQLVECHQGVNWASEEVLATRGRSPDERISDLPREGFHPGHLSQVGNVQQFAFRNEAFVYYSLDPELHHDQSYLLYWDKPKVVCSVTRFERKNPWRVAAAPDERGLVFSKRYFAFWADPPTLSLVLAILNSPVASAFSYVFDRGRDIYLRTLKDIPVPSLSRMRNCGVPGLVADLLHAIDRSPLAEEEARTRLLDIDAALLRAYDLPPRLEKDLLDTFEGYNRHTPFAFPKSYYPDGFDACIPLHKVLSEGFSEAIVSETLKRLKPIHDDVVSEVFSDLMEDHS